MAAKKPTKDDSDNAAKAALSTPTGDETVKNDPFGPTQSAERDETGYEPGSRMSDLVKELKEMGAR